MSRRRYVALGDSTAVGYGAAPTDGYVPRLHARLAGAVAGLVNLGCCGARTACVATDQAPRIPEAAALITVGVGANDVVHATGLDQVRSSWRALGQALSRREAPVVIGNVPDLSLAPIAALVPRAAYQHRVDAVNEIIAATCERHGFVLADLHAATRALAAAAGGPSAALFCGDGFHPSAACYRALAEAWWPAVASALGDAGRRSA
jgi:acyl-CoA thioesterase I